MMNHYAHNKNKAKTDSTARRKKYNIIETNFSTDQQDRPRRQSSKDIEDTNNMIKKGDEI